MKRTLEIGRFSGIDGHGYCTFDHVDAAVGFVGLGRVEQTAAFK
jgi:hypothetical protein